MAKVSHGPAIPESAKSQGAINGAQITSDVKRTNDLPERNIAQVDGSFRQVPSNKREDY